MAGKKIQMDFEKALKQADELEDIARQIENISKSYVQESFNGILKDWKGESSNSYIKKGTKVSEDIKKKAESLKKTAVTIREIVKKNKEAESMANKIATERTYSK